MHKGAAGLDHRVRLAALNAADCGAFTASVGPVFENSDWIAKRAWSERPFPNVAALHAALMGVVRSSSEADQVELIRAHPDLGGRLARAGRITSDSMREQSAAGLDQLSAQEIEHFDRLNAQYRTQFGFPFVICAREQTKNSIFDALEARTRNARAGEIATALHEIGKIARLRLLGMVRD
ncbi:MAG: 2-oxo-4-hydroxy-4-carboxy-5-ureidoimidazoline decarboxylase [Candidatus Eremiobacteraeota bacterium]|nr:2-oxo-4-hydroxy-4-carboxy-5-ureidoimidazoline decarboxylase [Candidatus Eremiobacteraeota bacterium]